MNTHRVIITTAPTAAVMDRAAALIAFAAVAAAGREATARRSYEPAQVSARAAEIRDGLVATIRDTAATDEATARMLAALVQTAGGGAVVVSA